MFLSKNKKNNVYPCKLQFYYIKVGLKGSKLYRYFFEMSCLFLLKEISKNLRKAGEHELFMSISRENV